MLALARAAEVEQTLAQVESEHRANCVIWECSNTPHVRNRAGQDALVAMWQYGARSMPSENRRALVTSKARLEVGHGMPVQIVIELVCKMRKYILECPVDFRTPIAIQHGNTGTIDRVCDRDLRRGRCSDKKKRCRRHHDDA